MQTPVFFKPVNELHSVQQSGLAAFKRRTHERAGIYSFEQNSHDLSPAFEKKFEANKKAWKFFTSKAPWYQRTHLHALGNECKAGGYIREKIRNAYQ